MPIINTTKGVNLTQRVTVAGNFMARLIGLLGTVKPDPLKAFFIDSCSRIHTFGMKYPIDVVFLDKHGRVVKLFRNFPPNKITKIIPSAHCTLELPPDTLKENKIQIGDNLKVVTDEYYHADIHGLKRIFHWPANFFIALLWSIFVLAAFHNWQQNGAILSLGLVLVNTLLFFLFLTRRESSELSHRILDWIIPMFTVGLSMILRPHPGANSLLNAYSGVIQFIGIVTIFCSLVSLGRSFGIIPANRRIKIAGTYKIVRHPLYTSEMLFYFGFLLGNMSIFNLSIIILIFVGQIYRAASEERLLSKEKMYLAYMAKIKYRFLPKIY